MTANEIVKEVPEPAVFDMSILVWVFDVLGMGAHLQRLLTKAADTFQSIEFKPDESMFL